MILKKKITWFDSPLNSINLHSHLINNSSNISFKRVSIDAVKTSFLYLVVNIKWAFKSDTERPLDTKSGCIIVVIFENWCYNKSIHQVKADMRTAYQ